MQSVFHGLGHREEGATSFCGSGGFDEQFDETKLSVCSLFNTWEDEQILWSVSRPCLIVSFLALRPSRRLDRRRIETSDGLSRLWEAVRRSSLCRHTVSLTAALIFQIHRRFEAFQCRLVRNRQQTNKSYTFTTMRSSAKPERLPLLIKVDGKSRETYLLSFIQQVSTSDSYDQFRVRKVRIRRNLLSVYFDDVPHK